VADFLTVAGMNRLLTIDLHAGQIQGFFNLPVDNLYAAPILAEYFRGIPAEDLMVVSPDAGGVERAGPSANAWRADWPSSTNGATGPIRPRPCTSSAMSRTRSAWSWTT
jgi:phosphoribosylpyrophosphate synthetase